MNGTFFGTLSGFPAPPYVVGFLVNGTTLFEESVPGNPGFINLRSADLANTGTFNYSDNSYVFVTSSGTDATITANFQPASTEVIRPEPQTGYTNVFYQARPEDQLDPFDTFDFADEYPWRRSIIFGGELIDFDSYAPATADIKTVPADNTAAVADQTGAQHDVQVVVPGPFPPRFVSNERSLDNYVPGQQAIAFSGTFLDLSVPRPSTGTLAGGLDSVMQPGWSLYHFGLVQGVLVADPVKFFGQHHRSGLAIWLPFNEQPLDAITVQDHSPFDSNPFVAGIASSNRKFDPVRGNYLSAQPGLTLTSPSNRGFGQQFAGGFWLRALNAYTNEQSILLSGPLKITLSGAANTPQVKFYLRSPSGTYSLQASQVFDASWVYISWSFDGNTQLTVDFFNATGVLTQQIIAVPFLPDFASPYSFTLLCQNSAFDIQDLRLWNKAKTATDLATTRYHSPNPTAALYRPAWLQSVNTYDRFAVRVLPSGFVVPDQLPTSIIDNKLAWVQRYDYFGRYEAQPRYEELGIGSGNTLPKIQRLGAQYDTLTLDGTVAISTWKGDFVGDNAPFRNQTSAGTYLSLPEGAITASGITAVSVYSGTVTPWPNPLAATNPCMSRIWVQGDDGFVWEAYLQTANGVTQFKTEKLFSESGAYQPTGAEFTLASSAGVRLAVDTSGNVYQGTYSGTGITDPLYMYSTSETKTTLSGTNLVDQWIQPNSFGLGQSPPVAALSQNGQIAFQINDTLPEGFYRITITSGNVGKVDDDFTGFATVMTVGDFIKPVRLCAGQKGADFTASDSFDFYLPHALPGSPSSWQLSFDWSNALKNTQKGTTRQLFIQEIVITQTRSSLYSVTTGSGIVITPIITAGSNFPLTPGGWLGKVSSWGTVSGYTHESNAYSSNDTTANPEPMANKLTTTTVYRREDLIMSGSFFLPDTNTPALPTYGSIVVT